VLYQLVASSYTDDSRDKTSVVIINEKAIDTLYQQKVMKTNEWPISYRDHAKILKRIANKKPEVIFVDILFYRQRNTDNS